VEDRRRPLEGLGVNTAFWKDRSVLVTGHTGFKGSWLCIWLHALGAEIHGYALEPPTTPSLFAVAGVRPTLASHTVADIRDYSALAKAVAAARPGVVFHLAAQPLVRASYRQPAETYDVNVMGVVHLLEAVRQTAGVKAVVNVTTDKCYENREWPWAYREYEPMGGHDPYASSKACAELVTAAYRQSFLAREGVAVATARAGNVIGGGDWAEDRLVPDFLRAVDSRTTLFVRSPAAVRPWQHVLEPLSGYLLLAERLAERGAEYAEPWNFGPADDDAVTVAEILDRLASRTPAGAWSRDSAPQPREAMSLRLDSAKARSRLGWRPRWRVAAALDRVIEWHTAWRAGADMYQVTTDQIGGYTNGAGADRAEI
jgi:CDP-glucose 4,6-dehydratase